MRQLILSLICLLALGCQTPSNPYCYTLPEDYESEVNGVLKYLKTNLSLKYDYGIKILSDLEMLDKTKEGSPHIKGNVFYIDDSYLTYIYKNFYPIRKMHLACFMVHEMCHREYNLPATPVSAHLEVDKRAIITLGLFNIPWYEYVWFLSDLNKHLLSRRAASSIYETDASERASMLTQYYESMGDKNWRSNATRKHKELLSNQESWNFNK